MNAEIREKMERELKALELSVYYLTKYADSPFIVKSQAGAIEAVVSIMRSLMNEM